MKILLQLKAEYKQLTGSDWKPATATGTTPKKQESSASVTPKKQDLEPEQVQGASMDGSPHVALLVDKIDKQGGKVRDLKAAKAPKVRNITLTPFITLGFESVE